MLANGLHARFVVTPDVAVVEPLGPEVARVQRFAGKNVIAERFDYGAQRAAVTESPPPAAPNCLVREDSLAGVVVDEPDLAARIHLYAGVAVHRLAVEEPAAVVGDDPDCLVDVLAALALEGEFVFCGHGAISRGWSGSRSGFRRICEQLRRRAGIRIDPGPDNDRRDSRRRATASADPT